MECGTLVNTTTMLKLDKNMNKLTKLDKKMNKF